jgi:hypothetical protein
MKRPLRLSSNAFGDQSIVLLPFQKPILSFFFEKVLLILLGIIPLINPLQAQSISTGTVTSAPFCPGNSITIPFTVDTTGRAFAASTITYQAQLSNASGSFASPISLGSTTSTTGSSKVDPTTALSISGTLPASAQLPYGTGYRVRVIKFSPGTVNQNIVGTNITLNSNSNGGLTMGLLITPNYPNPLGPFCVGDPISVPYTTNCPFSAGNIFQLQISSSSSSSFTTFVSLSATGDGTITGTIPDLPTGMYKLRIRSTNPIDILSSESVDFQVKNGKLMPMKASIVSPLISRKVYCQGETLNLTYSFNAADPISGNNVFQVQLSNASGSFASPTVIGQIKSTDKNGSIKAIIPFNLLEGSQYKIRIYATNGILEGCEYGPYIIPAIRPMMGPIDDLECLGGNAKFTITPNGASSYTPSYSWKKLKGAVNAFPFDNKTIANSTYGEYLGEDITNIFNEICDIVDKGRNNLK